MRPVTGSQPTPWAVIRGFYMKAVVFFLLAFAVPAMAQPAPAPKHFSDAELETILAYVVSLPRTRSE